ncbi:acyltransferase family protein [Listeria booriae]|uniref:acyltransferase family protein n=1 Tax=Listeria booriae TaxID=1552123 RepID=UPI00162A95F3|nr:acyltransferase family protein [Listeria booriae]MBC1233402.1 acyltransferase family protein [Listeria booriae]MBC1245178.1 acyltransferase family protein [Listeria booriae]
MMGWKRLNWIDNLRGLGMILVVWAHMNIPFALETIIYSFHMPLFFFISGYLYKKNNATFKEVLTKKATGLLIPYFFFATLSLPFGIAISIFRGESWSIMGSFMNYFYLDGSVGWNSPIWFLIVLFLIEISYFLIDRIKGYNSMFIVLCFVIGYVFSNTRMEFPLGLNIVFYGLVFYYIGQVLNVNNILGWLFVNKFRVMATLVLCIGLNVLFGFVLNSRVSIYHNELGNYLWFYIAAISACLALFILFKGSPSYRILTFIGTNSIVIMSTHYFFKYGFDVADSFVTYGLLTQERSLWISIMETVFILICSIPLIYLYNKYFFVFLSKKRKKSAIRSPTV